MWKTWIFILSFFSLSSFADPAELEVIFLSSKKIAQYQNILERMMRTPMSSSLAYMDEDVDCLPMGGEGSGCFHPQLGFIEDPEKPLPKEKDSNVDEVKTINNPDTNLINCDKKYYFDVYCGKAKKNAPPSGYEIWVDTSSSMKRVDWSKEPYCGRRRFIAKLQNDCPGKVSISTFNTGRKTLGSLEDLCINYGLNDGERIVDWIKGSKAKYLLIITDTDEYNGAFREYLDAVNAKIVGIGTTTTVADELMSYQNRFKSVCQ